MNTKFVLVAATVVACLTGCATPSQIQRQNDQLLLINANLQQIQANQMKSLAMQQTQAALQEQSNNLLRTQIDLQAQHNAPRSLGNSAPVQKVRP